MSGGNQGRRAPSLLAQRLSDAFAPCADWSEVRVVRNEYGRRELVIAEPDRAHAAEPPPYNWQEAA